MTACSSKIADVLAACVLIASLVFASSCSSPNPHDPRYEGKRLSVWVNDLSASTSHEQAPLQTAAYMSTWTNAVRAIGTNGLPLYLQWIEERNDSLRDYFAVNALQILGFRAEPAIPALADMLKNDQIASPAALCLGSIGPAAIPALIQAVETLTNHGQSQAIYTLADFGPIARPAIPALTQIAKRDSPLAWPAMQALVEIETNTALVLPMFVQHAGNTNNGVGAAYGLWRLGNAGIPTLLNMLTNENRLIQCSAAGALAPDFQKYSLDKAGASTGGIRRLTSIFNLSTVHAAAQGYSKGCFVMAAQTAMLYTNSTDVNIREAADKTLSLLRTMAATNIPQAIIDKQSGF
jgi:HEAT repeat protein